MPRFDHSNLSHKLADERSIRPAFLSYAIVAVAMKRPLDSTQDDLPRKKRIVAHVQRMPPHTEPAAQVAEFAQGQLLRSITAALTMAGFDSVKPTALEMFRSQVEECTSGRVKDGPRDGQD